MGLVLGVLLGAVLLVLGMRHWLLVRPCAPLPCEPFDGKVYRVGRAVVAERRSVHPRLTVLCMHGFVEDLRYFLEHYAAPDIQLLLVNSCDYHVPVAAPEERTADWGRAPDAREGTIAYDAAVLVQALEHLPRTDRIRVHGHSRGGAVILEAASRRPDLFARVEVVLEAPVLPRGRPYRPLTALHRWLLPFYVPLWRRQPISPRNIRVWGPLESARKRALISAYPFNPRRVSTMVANLRDLDAWMGTRDASVYRHIARGTVLVPSRDKVLDARAMLASAQRAGPGWRVVEVEGCSHFLLLDRPDVVPPLETSVAPLAAGAS